MQEEFFIRILNNTASEEEKEEFYLSLEKDDKLKEAFYQAKNIYALGSYYPGMYGKLQEENFTRFWNKTHPGKQNRSRKIQLCLRYAAVFILALGIGFLIRYIVPSKEPSLGVYGHIEYRSEKGSVSTIRFEDGSEIWLSSQSRISIDKNLAGETVVHLNGEAYFDLTPDSLRKFKVDLGNIIVRDIGTKFDIRAYAVEQTVYTTLSEGRINILKNTEKPVLSMKPGEYMRFDKGNNQITVSKIDPSLAIAWKDGKFVFIDKTLSQICQELENWYNIEIHIEDKYLADTRYTGVIKRTTTVSHVLEMLSVTDAIHYTIMNKKKSKDLVIIRK